MTRWMYPPEVARAPQQDQFDPIIEGARDGLSRELSLAIWERVRADATDSAGRLDAEQAQRRFRELAARIVARGGRLRPDIGRLTRVQTEITGIPRGAWVTGELAPRIPGKTTLVAAEMARWRAYGYGLPARKEAGGEIGRPELPGASEVKRAIAALQTPLPDPSLPPDQASLRDGASPRDQAKPPEEADARLPGSADVGLAVEALAQHGQNRPALLDDSSRQGASSAAALREARREHAPEHVAHVLPPATQAARELDARRQRPLPPAVRERRERAVARVERGFDALRGLARTVRTSRVGELARRMPGAAVLDELSGGRAGEIASASWRWLERFGSGGRAMASPTGAAAEVAAEVDPRAAGLDPAGGAPLPPGLRVRMSRLLGRDLSHVRVHTGAAADAAARALGARAVTIGSHIFFADGQFAPGTLTGDRLLVHELTHVAQHDNGRLPGARGDRVRVSRPSDPEEVEARAAERLAEEPSRPRGPRTIRREPPVGAPGSSAAGPGPSPAGPGPSHADASRRPTVGGQASRGLGDMLAGGAAFLVRQVSPGLADLIERGPAQVLRQAIQPAISSWVGSVTRGVDLRSVATSLTSGFASAFHVLQGARNGDPKCCDTLTSGIHAIRQLGEALMHNPAVQTIRAVIGRISRVLQQVLRVVLAPVFDVVKDLIGGVWHALSSVASTIAGWLRAVREAAGAAIDWVAHQLGFPAATGEGGLMDWLRHKAGEIWNQIKETLRPVATPLMAIGGVLVALSPFGPMLAAIAVVPPLVRSAQWLWDHRNDRNIIRSAHQEMGHTMLPRLLETGQSFVGAIRGAATWLGTQAVQLSSSLLQLAGALSGVPLLQMAQGFVHNLQQDVQRLVEWSQGAFHDAVEWCQITYTWVANFVRPYKEVLCSIGLAIASPPMIPVILAGWAWRWLPDCIKPPIVDLLLDIVLGALEAIPFIPMFGVLWPILKHFVIGFLRGFRNRTPAEKITLTNKLARILSGASPEFLLGFVIGVLKGVWDGIKQPFEAIWLLAEGLTTVVEYFQRLGGQQTWQPRGTAHAEGVGHAAPAPAGLPASPEQPPVAIPSLTPDNIQLAVAGVAGDLSAQERERREAARRVPARAPTPAPAHAGGPASAQMAQVAGEARQMAGELSGPVREVAHNLWPAVRELFQGGEGMTLDTFIQRLGAVWEAARGAIQNAGGQLAAMICDFFLQPSAERSLGEGVGYIAGMFAFQALLDYLSAGTWTGAMGVISQIARFLNWPNAAIGEAMQLLSRLGRYVLDGVRRLGSMIRSAASGALSRVMAAFTRIGEMLGGFAERLMGRAGAIEEAAVAGSHADDVARLGARTEEAAVAGARTEEAAVAGSHSDDAARAEERAGSRADDAAEGSMTREAVKARELPEALAVSRGITAAAERGHVPAPLLVMALDALKRRYTWITSYRVEARGGGTAILLIASEFVIDPRYDAQGDEDLAAWQARLRAERDAAEAAEAAAQQAAVEATDAAAAAAHRAEAARQMERWEQASARLEEVDARIARQAQIAREEQEGIEALARRREELWGSERLSGNRRLDESFWRRVDDPNLHRGQLEQVKRELEATRAEVRASRRPQHLIDRMDEDLRQQISKIDHRIARQEAMASTTLRGHGAQTDEELRARILSGERNVYAVDRAQAQRVSNEIESMMRRAAEARGEPFDPTHFHGPESHRGTGFAPDDPHFNIKSNEPGADFEVHIYFPP